MKRYEQAATSSQKWSSFLDEGNRTYEPVAPERPEGGDESWMLIAAIHGGDGDVIWYWQREIVE